MAGTGGTMVLEWKIHKGKGWREGRRCDAKCETIKSHGMMRKNLIAESDEAGEEMPMR